MIFPKRRSTLETPIEAFIGLNARRSDPYPDLHTRKQFVEALKAKDVLISDLTKDVCQLFDYGVGLQNKLDKINLTEQKSSDSI